MNVNMYLKHVMIDGCKWLLVVARGCIYTHNLGFRSAQSLYTACAYMYSYLYVVENLICRHMNVAFV